MAVLYPNFVLENKLTDLLNTKLAVKPLMTIDDSLVAEAGTKKKINTYTYTGSVEAVAEGATVSTRGSASVTTSEYEVVYSQQVFDIFDEKINQDPMYLDMCMQGAAQLMVNDMNTKFFAELDKATLSQTYAKNGAISYDTIVDSIAKMNLEDESALFVIIGNDLKAQLRKDDDFQKVAQGAIIANGQIATISGIPVIMSKLVPAKTAYVATKEAVKLFTKKESEVGQDRYNEFRKTTYTLSKLNLVALVDATKVVKITEALA